MGPWTMKVKECTSRNARRLMFAAFSEQNPPDCSDHLQQFSGSALHADHIDGLRQHLLRRLGKNPANTKQQILQCCICKPCNMGYKRLF